MSAKNGKWNWDENFLMHGGKFGEDFSISLEGRTRTMKRYIFKFVINKVHEISQCEETEYYDCVCRDEDDKELEPGYHCAVVSYFNNKFSKELKQFNLYDYKGKVESR